MAREGHPALGPTHVDTALVNHNLGCVCDMLGKTARGLELVEGAEKVRGPRILCTWIFSFFGVWCWLLECTGASSSAPPAP